MTKRTEHSVTVTLQVETSWLYPDDFINEHGKVTSLPDQRDMLEYVQDELTRVTEPLGGYNLVKVEFSTKDYVDPNEPTIK